MAVPSGDRTAVLGVCRVCVHDPNIVEERKRSTLSDGVGPIHLCCARLPEGATSCGPCRSAQVAAAEWEARGKRRANSRVRNLNRR